MDYATLKKMHVIQPDIELYEYKYSNEALLISELKKIPIEPKKIKLAEIITKESTSNSQSINNTSKNLENISNINFPKRNNEIIMKCLKQYKNFIKYMKFNNVSIDLLEKVCPYFIHKNILKNNYLFKENDKDIYFFCVITGKIGLRTFKPFSILENKRKYENEDINMEKVYILKDKRKIPKFENQNINDAIKNDNNENDNKVNDKDNAKNDNDDNNNDKDELKKNQKEEIDNINFEEKQMNKYFDINYNNIPGINKLLKDGYDTKILKKG